MLHDPDYRENQTRNQRAWHDRHPEYWRTYRGNNAKRPRRDDSEPVVSGLPLSGVYQIRFESGLVHANSDVCVNSRANKANSVAA